MGYYSELAIEDTYREDYSYPSPEMQLRWRIEDFKSRLEDTVGTNRTRATVHTGRNN